MKPVFPISRYRWLGFDGEYWAVKLLDNNDPKTKQWSGALKRSSDRDSPRVAVEYQGLPKGEATVFVTSTDVLTDFTWADPYVLTNHRKATRRAMSEFARDVFTTYSWSSVEKNHALRSFEGISWAHIVSLLLEVQTVSEDDWAAAALPDTDGGYGHQQSSGQGGAVSPPGQQGYSPEASPGVNTKEELGEDDWDAAALPGTDGGYAHQQGEGGAVSPPQNFPDAGADDNLVFFESSSACGCWLPTTPCCCLGPSSKSSYVQSIWMGHKYLNVGMVIFSAVVIVTCVVLAWIYSWLILIASGVFLVSIVYWPWDWRRIVVDLESDTVTVQRVLFCFGCPEVYPLKDYIPGCADDWSKTKTHTGTDENGNRATTQSTTYYHRVLGSKWTRYWGNSDSRHVNDHAASVQVARNRYRAWLSGQPVMAVS